MLLAMTMSPGDASPQQKTGLMSLVDDDVGTSSGFVSLEIRRSGLRALAAEQSSAGCQWAPKTRHRWARQNQPLEAKA
jgi:hypothetical protein